MNHGTHSRMRRARGKPRSGRMDDGDRDAGVHEDEPKQGVRPHLVGRDRLVQARKEAPGFEGVRGRLHRVERRRKMTMLTTQKLLAAGCTRGPRGEKGSRIRNGIERETAFELMATDGSPRRAVYQARRRPPGTLGGSLEITYFMECRLGWAGTTSELITESGFADTRTAVAVSFFKHEAPAADAMSSLGNALFSHSKPPNSCTWGLGQASRQSAKCFAWSTYSQTTLFLLPLATP